LTECPLCAMAAQSEHMSGRCKHCGELQMRLIF